jgi:hypothetical protein
VVSGELAQNNSAYANRANTPKLGRPLTIHNSQLTTDYKKTVPVMPGQFFYEQRYLW